MIFPFISKKKQKKKPISKIVEFPKVKDVMTKKVVAFDADDTISHAINEMVKRGISGAPVVKRRKVVGIIHESDLMDLINENIASGSPEEFSKKINTLSNKKVSEIMMKNPVTISPNEGIEEAVKKMYKHGVDRLPVVDRGKLVGIIARDDVIRGLTSSYLAKIIKGENVKTIVDQIIRELKKNPNGLSISELEDKLGVDSETIERWARVLEDHGIITIEYPVTGGKILKIKKR